MEKSTIVYPFPTTEMEIIQDNIEEYNNYITQKNKRKKQYKVAKNLIIDSMKNKKTHNLLDIWEGQLTNQNIDDSYQNIQKIIYYDNNSNISSGIHFDDEIAKYFIDNYRIMSNDNSFLFYLYPSSFQNEYQTINQLVIITQKNIYFTNNCDTENPFNIISL